ncbi:poly + rna export protein [Diplodia corticola]|uniref:Poly + rna export protein n=1 Tax=Diplodia corticola TaxID=236234 RepID=A0A1J9R6D0_9PEZI|nr:poly + rna export protein [Diplodia corticola]OJD36152.1 poly + rna export protein [Diplodia corticola]
MAGLFGAGSTSSASNPTQGDTSKDLPINSPPSDSISEIAFSPTQDILAASSWDGSVYVWQIDNNGQSNPATSFKFDAPALCCAWAMDGSSIIGAGADKTAKRVDLGANPTPVVIAQHDQPIRSIKATNISNHNVLVTGSWDKSIKYWDIRASNVQPVISVSAQERVYTMDVKDKLLVVGTADRYIDIINIDNPNTFYKTMQSPLKWQTRVVSCFSDATGFAVGSIEGRCAIQYVEEKDASSNFSFKCHRVTDDTSRDIAKVFSVNAISFHPQHGTFSTAGSDGTFHFWDKDAKHRLKGYPGVGGPITSTAFNASGSIFAYAVSYDWSKGYAHNNQSIPTKIMLHPVQAEECKPRPGSKKR